MVSELEAVQAKSIPFQDSNICSLGKDLKFLQAYKGSLPSMQVIHWSSMLTVYDSVCG